MPKLKTKIDKPDLIMAMMDEIKRQRPGTAVNLNQDQFTAFCQAADIVVAAMAQPVRTRTRKIRVE